MPKFKLAFQDGRELEVHAPDEKTAFEHGTYHETERVLTDRAKNRPTAVKQSSVARVDKLKD
jgi:hypothetical protein